jgi:hypothetical protein
MSAPARGEIRAGEEWVATTAQSSSEAARRAGARRRCGLVAWPARKKTRVGRGLQPHPSPTVATTMAPASASACNHRRHGLSLSIRPQEPPPWSLRASRVSSPSSHSVSKRRTDGTRRERTCPSAERTSILNEYALLEPFRSFRPPSKQIKSGFAPSRLDWLLQPNTR